MNIRYLAMSACISVGACDDARNSSADEVMDNANSYVSENLSGDLNNLRPTVFDDGNQWIVSYHLAPDYVGGEPIVVVDKATKMVVSAYTDQ